MLDEAHLEKVDSYNQDKPVKAGDRVITLAEVADYVTSDLWEAIRAWKNYQRFGLPHGGGMVDETADYIDAINAMLDTYNTWQSDKYKRQQEATT